MGDSKEYLTQKDELGNIMISEDVLAVITAAAAADVEGVTGLYGGTAKDLTELLGIKNQTRGIRVELTEQSVRVDVSISVKYGYTVVDVARAVQDAVYSNIEAMSGLKAECVNVNVGGVTFERKAAPKAAEK